MFKKIILGILCVAFFIGCHQDPVYDKVKTIYVKGKKVVIKNWNYLPDNVKTELKTVDTLAKGYDKIHSKIFKKKDVNYTKALQKTK